MDLVLRAERVLLGGEIRPAAVAVAEGTVVDIGPPDAAYAAQDDVWVPAGAVLLPGFVDTHVHINAPGTDWEGFATATEAAARAGITTVVDMPLDSVPVTTTIEALRIKQAAAQSDSCVDVAFWGGVVPGNLGALHPLAEAGVRGFKCFLADSGNPDFPHLSPAQFRAAAAEVAALDAVLLVHAESHAVLAASPSPSGAGYASFLASRPDSAEVDAVALALDTARGTGVRLHLVHVSSGQTLELIADAKAAGVAVTAETCPHYLTFAAETIPDGATQFAACPPIRACANRDQLWSALADGTLDMIVSDHSPCTPELKGDGDFRDVFAGISSLQLSPRAAWTQAAERGFGLADLSRWMSERPARLAGFTDRGHISVGARADLCAFDPDTADTVHAAELRHRHPVSPYDGSTLRGGVLATWVAGDAVYRSAGVAA
ncbi:allantoinase [Mycobacterium sp. BK558]|nr:allantoinase [Mycobacterium sp. BK558]